MTERELPGSWAEAEIGSVCEVNPRNNGLDDQTDVTFVPMGAVDDVSGKIMQPQVKKWGDVKKGYTHFRQSDVIFAKITPCMENRKCAVANDLVNGVGAGSTEFHVMRPFSGIAPEFLWYFLRQASFVREAAKHMTGSAGQKRVPTQYLATIRIPIPPPGEQKRIVSKIESTFSKVESIEKAATEAELLLNKYRESLLARALRGELVRQDPNDESASILLDRLRQMRKEKEEKKKAEIAPITEDEIPFEIPASWRWVRLAEVVHAIDAGWSPQCEPRPRNGNEWGVLKISAVTWGKYQPEENKALPSKLEPRPEHEVKKGDVIISRANTAELVGRGVIVEESPPRLLLNDKLLRIQLSEGISSDYFNLVNNGKIGRSYYESVASGTSSSMRNITRDQIRRMVIPLPPTQEQHRIVSAYKSSAREIEFLTTILRETRDQKALLEDSILRSAFQGRLVSQVPSEGTGRELLQRLGTVNKTREKTNTRQEKQGRKRVNL